MSDGTVLVDIDTDEWWPVYSAGLATEWEDGVRVEIPVETWERWSAAQRAFRRAQEEMRDAVARLRAALEGMP